MSTALAKNVEAYEPETDPAGIKIDYDSLIQRGWPSSVLDCMRELQSSNVPGSGYSLDIEPFLSKK